MRRSGALRLRSISGLHENETSAACTWHIPAAHYLESWGDAKADDGVLSPIQPMIDPILGGITPLELLARVIGYETADAYEIVRRSFRRFAGETPAPQTAGGTPAPQSAEFEAMWRRYLNEGVYIRSEGEGALVLRRTGGGAMVTPVPAIEPPSATSIEIGFAPSHAMYDGRFANNAWMQEWAGPDHETHVGQRGR